MVPAASGALYPFRIVQHLTCLWRRGDRFGEEEHGQGREGTGDDMAEGESSAEKR